MVGNYKVSFGCGCSNTFTNGCAGYVAETTTFLAECAEDESDLVVKESHRLKKAVESVAGNISGI